MDVTLDATIVQMIEDGKLEELKKWLEEVKCEDINELIDIRDTAITTVNSELQTKSNTALHYACFFGQIEIVNHLLQIGASPACPNKVGETPLHAAVASQGDELIVKVVELLLTKEKEKKEDVSHLDVESEEGWTPLLTAVYLNLPKTVELLLEEGADPTKCYYEDDTSLTLAARNDGSVLEILLGYEALRTPEMINKVCQSDGYKCTALHQAVLYLQEKCVQLLVDYGADTKIRDSSGNCPIHYTFMAKDAAQFLGMLAALEASINEQDKADGFTLLHLTIINNKAEYVPILRNDFFNADFMIKDKIGKYPLHYLCEHHGNEDLVYLLTDRHAIKEADKKGYQPIHLAVKRNDHKLVGILLRAQARSVEVNEAEAPGGRYCVHLAVLAEGTDKEFWQIITELQRNTEKEEFLEQLNKTDADGNTALHLAMEHLHFGRVDALLDFGADPGITDSKENGQMHNVIHMAATTRGSDEDFMKVVDKVRSKSSTRKFEEIVNAQDKSGKTALYLALEEERWSRACKLLGCDADSSIADNAGKNCLHVAFEKSYPGDVIVELLQKAKKDVNLDGVLDNKMRFPLQYFNKSTPISAITVLPKIHRVRIGQKNLLTQAVDCGRLDIVKVLLIKGTQVDVDILKQALITENCDLAYILVRHADNIATTLTTPIDKPNYSGQQKQGAFVETTLFKELIVRMPSVALEALERCVKVDEKKAEFNYSYIHANSDSVFAPTALYSDVSSHPLQLMVEHKRTELLQSPVVRSYLFTMWNVLGFWYFLSYMLIFLLFLGSLTLFSLTVNNPLLAVCNVSSRENISIRPIDGDCGSYSKYVVSNIFAAIVLVTAVIQLVMEIIRWCFSGREYFRSLQNYIEIILFPFSIVYVFVFTDACGCPKDWQWQIGLFVVFAAWMNLIIIASEFPKTGTYVIIFKEIFLTFLELLLSFGIILILAYTVILFMMFYSPTAMISSFSNYGHSVVKTMTTVTGELGFEDLFDLNVPPDKYLPIPFFASNFILWIIFLFLIPICLNNMLTSLAVGDTNEVLERAELQKLTLQVKTVVKAYEIVPGPVKMISLNHAFERSYLSSKVFLFKEKESYWKKLQLFVWGGKEFYSDVEEDLYNQKRNKEREEIH